MQGPMGPPMGMGGMGGMGGGQGGGGGSGAPREGMDGNWKCTSCSNVNFVQRMACNRCSASKPPPDVLEARAVEIMTTGAVEQKKGGAPQEGVDGNWRCVSCNNVNWMQRENCFRCGITKPSPEEIERRAQELALAGQTGSPAPVYPKGPGSANKAPMEGVDGNWRCMSCSNVNWAQRDLCHRCNSPKPAGGGMQQYLDAATGQVYTMSADGQIAPAYGMANNGMPGIATGGMAGMAGMAAAGGGSDPSMPEMRQRLQGLETQVATLQQTLQPQISNLSAALQQVQTLVAQMQQQMLSTLGEAVGSKRKAEANLAADDPKRSMQ